MEATLTKRDEEVGRIEVELLNERGCTRRKAFTGRWLIGDSERGEKYFYEDGGCRANNGYSVALTAKGHLVVIEWDEDGDTFDVHEDFEAFAAETLGCGCPRYPETLVEAVADVLGVVRPTEELDI